MGSCLTGRFGVEIELNSLDCRDFISNPLLEGERPSGIEHIASLVSGLGLDCEVHDWRYNHNPSGWSCKPDRSCGIELCSPVLDHGSKEQLIRVVDALSSDPSVSIDSRCSLHVHLELSGMDFSEEAASILAWWIKCEHVFIDFAAPCRKNNFYCKPIGITDLFDSEEEVSVCEIFRKLSDKHFSANSFHFFNKRRPTLEFRIGEGTSDSLFVVSWVEILICFARSACIAGLPSDYLWVSPSEVLEFLNLESDLEGWFLERLIRNSDFDSSECFSRTNRKHANSSYILAARKPSPL